METAESTRGAIITTTAIQRREMGLFDGTSIYSFQVDDCG